MELLATLDANYLPRLKVMLVSLWMNNPGESFRLWLLHRGIPETELELSLIHIWAMETSTSALMSKAVTRPIIASRIIGRPQRIIATQAASKGRGSRSKILKISEMPPRIKNVMSFFVPPHSKNSSSFSMKS